MDSIRRPGLHPIPEGTPPVEQGTVDMTSFSDTVLALSGNQPPMRNCTRLTILGATLSLPTVTHRFQGNDPGYVDDDVSISSGSLSPDLGEMRRYGFQRSPDWESDGDGEIEDGVEEKEVREYVAWNMRHVLEGALWASVLGAGRCSLYAHDSPESGM